MALTALALVMPPGRATVVLIVCATTFVVVLTHNPAQWLRSMASACFSAALVVAVTPAVSGFLDLGSLGALLVHPPVDFDLQRYLSRLLPEVDHINITGIRSRPGASRDALRRPIEELYTPLRSHRRREPLMKEVRRQTLPRASALVRNHVLWLAIRLVSS